MKYGCAMQSLIDQDDLIVVPGIHGRAPREIARSVLSAIIEPRLEEMFTLALREFEKSGMYDSIGAGMVLTGGACLLPGTIELAERIMGLPVKIGIPNVSGGLVETVKSPIYATAVGLIQYAIKRVAEDDGGPTDNIRKKVSKFFKNLFEDLF